MRYLYLAVAILMTFGLTACQKPAAGSDPVIGSDLGHDWPFGTAGFVRIADRPDGDDAVVTRLDITRSAPEDHGLAVNIVSNTTKPFDAGVSYLRLRPIVAETNADARDYWLVGLNLSRTRDRSVYMLLRYPAALQLAPGIDSDAFEYAVLTCNDLDVARRPADYYAPRKESEPGRPEPKPDPAPEAGPCEFNSPREVAALAPLVLKRYDQIRHYEDAPTLHWLPAHAEIR
ncbi:hypothetical protein [Asticcacaulis solisilvae]|uniref:hypothetical protein n=1 Tax=Asticcacaulis solisilvae TaxID=1217274 RepID=UPI003FD7D264